MDRERWQLLGLLGLVVAVVVVVPSWMGSVRDPLDLSLQIAGIATLLSLVVGTAIAVFLDWRKLPGRASDFLDAVVSAPLVLPPTVLGYYILVVLGADSALGRAWENLTGTRIVFSFTGAVVAAGVGSLPLIVRSARVGLAAVDPNLIAAARTLGAPPWRVLVTIVLPLALPGIVAGAMMGFARALGDYGATMMVAGSRIDGVSPGSIYVMDALYAPGGARDIDARNMSIVMTLVGVSLLYTANRLLRRLYPRG
jgi:molybdate transport system permease protein